MKDSLFLVGTLFASTALTVGAQTTTPAGPAGKTAREVPKDAITAAVPATPAATPFGTAVSSEEPADVASSNAPLGPTSELTVLDQGGSLQKLGYWTAGGRDGATPVSIIAFKPPDQRTLDETAEDLNIMSYILAQNLERTPSNEANEYKLGIPMLLKSGGKSVEATYIQRFGAVFNLRVGFPLIAPTNHSESPESAHKASEWEKARSALLGASESNPQVWRVTTSEHAQPYDPTLVETLKRRVLELLHNASNFRHLKPDEFVAVVISGPPNPPAVQSGSGRLGQAHQNSFNPYEEVRYGSVTGREGQPVQYNEPLTVTAGQTGQQPYPQLRYGRGSGAQMAPERLTIMTVLITKANADAFAAKTLSQDQFFQRAEVCTYLGPATVGASTGGWLRY